MFYCPLHRIKTVLFCSKKCHYSGSIEKFIHEWSDDDLKKILENLYLEQKKSLREIKKYTGISNKRLSDLLKYFNIQIRTGSVAVKTQWIGEKGKKRKEFEYEKSKKRIMTSDGYFAIRIKEKFPQSFGNGYIKEHVYIMQKNIGRIITKQEIVHHKNGDKLDNRIENLEIMSPQEHARIHYEQRKTCPVTGRFL